MIKFSSFNNFSFKAGLLFVPLVTTIVSVSCLLSSPPTKIAATSGRSNKPSNIIDVTDITLIGGVVFAYWARQQRKLKGQKDMSTAKPDIDLPQDDFEDWDNQFIRQTSVEAPTSEAIVLKTANEDRSEEYRQILQTSDRYEWNQWREENPSVAINLAGIDLSGRSLRGYNFFRVDFRDANLERADMRDADLKFADLRHANLTSSNLSSADFSYAQMQGCNLSHSLLHWVEGCGADLMNANISFSSVMGANLRSTILTQANLESSNFLIATLDGAVLNRANCQSTRFEASSLLGCLFKGSNLEQTDFHWAETEGCDVDIDETDLVKAA